jgi:formylglycine-generating enzyme required for sulfatase activity
MGKLRAKTGFTTQIDLPTEAQWEHAFRANTSGASYTNSTEYAALGRCGGSIEEAKDAAFLWTPDQGGTMYVGSYPPNPWGLYDMFGNVHERCLDGWLGNPAGVEYGKEQIDPPGPSTSDLADCNNRVARGGSWDTTGVNWFLHYKRRNFKDRSSSLGFRTVVNCR